MSHLITRRRSVTNAPPTLSASTAPGVSAPLIGEPTPLTEATPMLSVHPLIARRPHRRRREPDPSDHTSAASKIEGEASQPAATAQQHSIVASSCGVVIKQNCPMQWEKWVEIPDMTKDLVRDKLSVIFDLDDISPEVKAYLDETLAIQYKHWKNYLHAHFKLWDTPEIARLHGYPIELKDWLEDWEWLCKHFTDPKFVKKSIVGKIARESKTLLHHSGSKPFSYRLETRRQEGSKFPEIDLFEDVYVRPGDETAGYIAVLQEATSQLPPDTPIEDVMVPEDAGFQILTDVLDQNFSRRHGKVVRCMGKARLRETGASSSRSNTAEGKQMKEQIRAQGEQLHTYAGQVRDLIQAIQMTGLQISLPVPDLATPLTSEPLHPADTQ
ncbi:hypothetical protein D8674_019399 [Pyrus ussuriensis x Pyrus communis]|uniref:Uncharacterized protein n=1 Tax=Pyrus ussuriensis x Pyrus communis TaxID=2448454 RepID=A0A5N5G851_9ROSA|nr:hypothetical protein D8674_019399 [Pyrus ussuriensis x Pyrus communis]